jgi:hypothetical protein
MNSAAITVKFPAPLPAEVVCPICSVEGSRGGGCKVCNFNGTLNITVDAKVPIQRGHIIQYVSENMKTIASELTRYSGLVPEVETIQIIENEGGQFEIVQISSLGGAVWIANRLDELQSPMYFYAKATLNEFVRGLKYE